MTVSYDPTTLIGQVREMIGDTNITADGGVKPDGTNISDEQITNALAAHGSDVELAAARICNALAALWTAHGGIVEIDRYKISSVSKPEQYRTLARQLRSSRFSFATF